MVVGLAGAALGAAFGCSSLLGLSDYKIGDAGPTSCNANLTTQCFPCTPTTDPQFLNACTDAACVPFDDQARIAGFVPDGALPPVPDVPMDGGVD